MTEETTATPRLTHSASVAGSDDLRVLGRGGRSGAERGPHRSIPAGPSPKSRPTTSAAPSKVGTVVEVGGSGPDFESRTPGYLGEELRLVDLASLGSASCPRTKERMPVAASERPDMDDAGASSSWMPESSSQQLM